MFLNCLEIFSVNVEMLDRCCRKFSTVLSKAKIILQFPCNSKILVFFFKSFPSEKFNLTDKVGGAKNHRFGLYDKILIKDNHIKMIGDMPEVISIINKSKKKNVMVECDTFNQANLCMKNGIRYILLDNMKLNQIKKCIEYKNKHRLNTKIEISGGINFNNIQKYIFLGADYISTSSLTNCSKSIDIGLDIL